MTVECCLYDVSGLRVYEDLEPQRESTALSFLLLVKAKSYYF
jgi:hypothetical protein